MQSLCLPLKAGDVSELCGGDIVADIRTIYQSKIGSESGRAGAQFRPNMDTASLVSDHHQSSSFLQLTLFWRPFIYLFIHLFIFTFSTETEAFSVNYMLEENNNNYQ